MKTTRILASLLAAGLTFSLVATADAQFRRGGRGGGGDDDATVLLPSQIDARLATLDATNPFTGEADPTDRVAYEEVDMTNYDAFFRDAAGVQGTIVLTNNLVETLTTGLDSGMLTQALSSETLSALYGGATDISDQQRRQAFLAIVGGDLLGTAGGIGQDQLNATRDAFFAANPEIASLRTQIEVLVPILTDLPNRAQALVATGQSLVSNAPNDFLGPNALKLPRILRGLEGALSDLGNAAGSSATALGGLTTLFSN